MILDPTPKPIRFRIESGGVEHSSLESLRQHFCWREVRELIQEGRLQEWLKNIGHTQLADDLDIHVGSSFPDWSYAGLLFGVDLSKGRWLDLAEYWMKENLTETIKLNLDEWLEDKNVSKIAELLPREMQIIIGERLYDKVHDVPYTEALPSLKKAANMGSDKALLRIADGQKKRRPFYQHLSAGAKKSFGRLEIAWKDRKRITDNYSTELWPVVFLLDLLQSLRKEAGGDYHNLYHLADLIESAERFRSTDDEIKDFCRCAVIVTYYHLGFSETDIITDEVVNKRRQLSSGVSYVFRMTKTIKSSQCTDLVQNKSLQASLLRYFSGHKPLEKDSYVDYLNALGDSYFNPSQLV